MNSLDERQLTTLYSYISVGTADAYRALSAWLGRHVRVSMEPLEQVSLEAAVEQLGPFDEIVCACCMRVTGGIDGQLLLGFDDASGLMLCDMLMNRESRSTVWGELEMSSAMETTNIVGSALLNSLARIFPSSDSTGEVPENALDPTWIPSPPVFVRDYAAAIMQFALMDQAGEFDTALVARAKFTIDDMPIGWRLLLIPDAKVLDRLARTLR